MKDIAEDLGVSLMTISKALRGHRDISDETRRRVVQRAQELGYRPNWAARSLATGRTQLVGLVIPDLMNSFFAEIAKSISKKLEPLSYHTVICNSEEQADTEDYQIGFLLARNVEGLIIASSQINSEQEIWQELEESKIPYVLIDRLVEGVSASFVGVKDDEIGFLATNHLLECGYQHIAHIRGPAVTTGVGRLAGYQRALQSAGIPVRTDYIVEGHFDDENGYKAMVELLTRTPRPDGVFCYNDPVAAGAIRAVFDVGLGIPDDVGIIGAGNIHYSDLLRVPLTTVDQGSPAIGEAAADLLLRSLNAKGTALPEQIFISPKLIVRETTRLLR